MKTLDARLRDLARALKGLRASESDRSRRFWRKKFSAASRALKAQALTEYPGPKVERAPAARVSTRRKRLEAAGFTQVSSTDTGLLLALARAGVRVKHVQGCYYAPAWATTIGADVAKLTKARLDRAARKKIVRRIELTDEAKKNGIPESAIKSVVRAAETQDTEDVLT